MSYSLDVPITPLGDGVLIHVPEGEEKTSGGIILPDAVKEKGDMQKEDGFIVKLGSEAFILYDPDSVKPKPGDRVMINKYAGRMTEHEGVKYRVINCDEIKAIYHD